MEINKISDGKGGNYIIMTSLDIEKVNPVEFYSERDITFRTVVLKNLMRLYRFPIIDSILNKVISKIVKQQWDEKYKEIKSTEVPKNLKHIFSANKKKDQVKLLKGLTITSDILIAFLFYAWEEQGYSFSQYKGEHQRKGLDEKELPTVVYIEDDKVERIGESELSNGQLKQAIQERTVVVAKFLDKEDEWHCLFATYNSFKGEENWQNGQPHFHYISNKFGISREKVVESLKSRYYKLGSLPHINISDYGNQPE